MSFSKAQDLIRLAQLAAARRCGISLEEISLEFGVSHRTAQRMTDALEEAFGNVLVEDGEDRKRRWRLIDPGLDRLQLRHETGVEALEIAVRGAEAEGRLRHARALADLREGLLAQAPSRSRIETDAEAVLAAMGQVTRPGPKVSVETDVLDAIIEALRGPFRLSVRYNQDDANRILEPHGVLLGHRTYLAARDPAKADEVRNFRIDLIRAAEVLDESFPLQEGFSIVDYAARSFGVWQDPEQYGEVIWRFAPDAAGPRHRRGDPGRQAGAKIDTGAGTEAVPGRMARSEGSTWVRGRLGMAHKHRHYREEVCSQDCSHEGNQGSTSGPVWCTLVQTGAIWA